jgi:transcriptional regulator with XRE-family HTH domain
MAEGHSELYRIIGNRISELRKFKNDNQQDLAKKIGLKRSTISNIELGRQQITLEVLYRICQVYDTEIYSLLPQVNIVASKVSLELENSYSKVLEKEDVGNKTRQEILQLLK